MDWTLNTSADLGPGSLPLTRAAMISRRMLTRKSAEVPTTILVRLRLRSMVRPSRLNSFSCTILSRLAPLLLLAVVVLIPLLLLLLLLAVVVLIPLLLL